MTTQLCPDAASAFQKFKARFSNAALNDPLDWRRFDTPTNQLILLDFIRTRLAANSEVVPDSWEIAFKNAIRDQAIEPIAGWERPITQEERDSINSQPAPAQRYRTDAVFRELADRMERQDAKAGRRFGENPPPDPYVNLTAQQYRSLPPQQANLLLTRSPQFAAAVTRLRDAGEI